MIEAPEFILSTISDSYKIPFMVVPSYSFKKKKKSAYLHSHFVSEAIEELFKGTGSPKLDLRIINKCVYKQKFKFEDHKKASEYFAEGCFLPPFPPLATLLDWIPRTLNTQADFVSKIRDCDDWRFWNPWGCAGVDALYQPWLGENCLIVPPVNKLSVSGQQRAVHAENV